MAILILILLILIPAFGCFVRAFYSVNRKPKDPYTLLNGPQYEASGDKIRASTRIMDAAEFETVTIRSYDGTRLTARYYHHKDGAPVKIFSMAIAVCRCGTAQADTSLLKSMISMFLPLIIGHMAAVAGM